MLRCLAILLLLTAFTAQTFHQAVIVLGYYVNTAAFEARCVNKQAPQMKCKGKCQMAKKLQEEEKNDRQAPQRRMEQQTETLSAEHFFAVVHPRPFSINRLFHPVTCEGLPAPPAPAIFHPPSLV
jgi:hypothetical protein